MNKLGYFLIFIFISNVLSGAILDEKEQKSDRVHEHKLSDHDHYSDSNEHNVDYDHEAFLGKDEVSKMKSLTPEESKQRLGEIFDKIDVDNDGAISESELHQWIKNISKMYIMKDVDARWKYYDTKNAGSFNLDQLLDVNYGALMLWSEEDKSNRKKEYDEYMRLMKRDKRRFKLADADEDGKLNKSEYANFLHPEEAPHMREVIIEEALEDLDKNRDGAVDVEEFINDVYPEKKPGEDEPDWVKNERENYAKYRDANGDGKMDKGEVANWIVPSDYDHTLAEAKHLIYEADIDQDQKLSKDEMLAKASLFVSSQATGYGDVLHKREDL